MAKKQASYEKNVKAIKSQFWRFRFQSTCLLRDPRTRKIVGGVICLFAIFMFLSFLSFLFTWKVDDSAVSGSAEYFRNNHVRNEKLDAFCRGETGLLYLMRSGFGLTAFTLPYLVAIVGLRIYTNSRSFNIYLALKYTLLIITFFSLVYRLGVPPTLPKLSGWVSAMVYTSGWLLWLVLLA